MVRRADRYRTEPVRSAPPAPGMRLWIEVDHDALRDNVQRIRARLRRGCQLIAVVKGNAYGHGAVPVARTAIQAGAAALAVASAAEGAALRAAGITADVLIIGPSLPEDVETILEHDLTPAIADPEFARALDRAAREPCRVQIEVETGLNRFGVDAGEAVGLVHLVRSLPSLRLSGIYTHFSSITPADRDAVTGQYESFDRVLGTLRDDGLRPFAHACNTLSSVLLPHAHLDALRLGGALHGLGATARGLGMTPTLTLRTKIAAIQRVPAGDRVGYAGTHRCERDTILAVLPCGYADGLMRATWTGRDVLVHGCRAPIVGLVSMNQTVVDVGHVPGDVAPGDEVVLVGAQGDDRVRAEERVPTGGSSYEVTTLLNPSLPRSHRNPAEPGRR